MLRTNSTVYHSSLNVHYIVILNRNIFYHFEWVNISIVRDNIIAFQQKKFFLHKIRFGGVWKLSYIHNIRLQVTTKKHFLQQWLLRCQVSKNFRQMALNKSRNVLNAIHRQSAKVLYLWYSIHCLPKKVFSANISRIVL